MSANVTPTLEVEDIHSPSDVQLLDDIDRLRSNGVSHLVALPQLIVVGDQSSGKSSVLEAVSGIPFPTKDNLCTRFATEVVLRRAPIDKVKVTIRPGPERDPDSAAALQSFSQDLSDWGSLSAVIDAARKEMGLTDDTRTFTDDVLRVDVSGPTQPHLTIVDLPGLIHYSKAQADDDVQTVQQLVRGYMTSARSIILAIVSAKNDSANQIVLHLAGEVDPRGIRTMGIITKPDTLIQGSESETDYLTLAKNQDVYFALGWHVLKNRDYTKRNSSLEDRNRDETSFLSTGVWAQLPRSDVAIVSLRRRLSRVLLSQIKRELPNLVREIELQLEDTTTELRKLGTARNSQVEQQNFLLHLSQDYQILARAAVNGLYDNPFFEDPRTDNGYSKRFRAVLQNSFLEFSESMRLRGHRYIISKDDEHPVERPGNGQDSMTRTEFIAHAKMLLSRTRGRELPGTFNPMLIADLFREQCTPWKGLIHEHVNSVFAATMRFVRIVFRHLTQEEVAERILQEIIDPAMRECMGKMNRKVECILNEIQVFHPITYNRNFTEKIQTIRAERIEIYLTKRMHAYLGSDSEKAALKGLKVADLVQALSIREVVNMDSYACEEAVDCMLAYYQIALDTLVDNVARQCIEKVLVVTILDMFSTDTVLYMEPGPLRRMAQESDVSCSRRDQLKAIQKLLESGLDTCRKHGSIERDPNRDGLTIQSQARILEDFTPPSQTEISTEDASEKVEVIPAKGQELAWENLGRDAVDVADTVDSPKPKKKSTKAGKKASIWADEV